MSAFNPEGDSIYYDPNMDDQVNVSADYMEYLRKNVKEKIEKGKEGKENVGELQENLGELKENLGMLIYGKDHLSLVVGRTGDLPGLIPRKPYTGSRG